MPRVGFYIIRCPQCGRYTYAPTRQKTRLCVFCQRIFKIDPLNAIFEEDATTARTRVKLYQTGKHHEEFLAAVEKSRETIRALIPETTIGVEKLHEEKPERLPVSSRRREFERILHQQAQDAPVDLQVIEEVCDKAGIPWNWAAKQIQMLIQSGHLIAPKPWQIRLVSRDLPSDEAPHKSGNITVIAQKIGELLRRASLPLTATEIVEQLGHEAVTRDNIEKTLDLLRTQGYILKTTEGTYRWTSD
jgi:hypothetical protein